MNRISIIEIAVSLEDTEHEYTEDVYIQAPFHYSRQQMDAIALIQSSKPFEAEDSINEWMECLSFLKDQTKDNFGVCKSITQFKFLDPKQSAELESLPIFSPIIPGPSIINDLYSFINKCITNGEELDSELLASINDCNPDLHKVICHFAEKAKSSQEYEQKWFEDLFQSTDNPSIKQNFDEFFDWLDSYKGQVNSMVDVKLLYGDEYPDENLTRINFWGDILTRFHIAGTEFEVITPYDFRVTKTNGELDITLEIRDIGTDHQDYFNSLLQDIDVNKLPKEHVDALIAKMDRIFHQYFDIEKVPMWKTRLLNSLLITEDFKNRLIDTEQVA